MTDIVYGNLKVTSETAEKLADYCRTKLGVESNNKDDFHCTFIYSRETATSEELMDLGAQIDSQISTIPVIARATGIQRLGDSIALTLDSELIESFFIQAQELGASYDYESYICHLSLFYTPDKGIDIDDVTLPDFPIKFDRCEVIMSTDEYDLIVENEDIEFTDEVEDTDTMEMDVEGFGMVNLSFGESIFRNYSALGKIEEANKSNWSQYWIAKTAKRVKRPASKLKWKYRSEKDVYNGDPMMYLHDVERDFDYLAYNINKKQLMDWIDDNSSENWSSEDIDLTSAE